MNHKNRQGLFTLALVSALTLLPGQAIHATNAAPTQRQVIDRFITYSNFAPQLEQLPLMVREQIEKGMPNTLSSAQQQQLSTLMLDAFEAERARAAMTQQLSLGYDNRRFLALIQRLENPVIRKLRGMEQAIYEPVAHYELLHFISRFDEESIPPKREKLIKGLIKANGSIENTVMTRTTLQEVLSSLSATATDRGGNALEQNLKMAESLRPAVEKEVYARALFTYRNATDEDLQQYIDFYNSAAGEWFKLTQQNGWFGALRNIGRDVAWKMQHPGKAAGDVQTAFEDELEL